MRRLVLLIMLLVVSACTPGRAEITVPEAATMPPELTITPLQLVEAQASTTPPVQTIATLVAMASTATAGAVIPTATPFPKVEVIPSLAEGAVQILTDDNFLDPPVLTITVGTTVEWTPVGVGEEEHTIISTDNKQGWPGNGGVDGFGDPPFQVVFREPGVYAYYCSVHPGEMDGVVVVLAAGETGGSP